MNRRQIVRWIIFLGVLALLGIGAALGGRDPAVRAVQYGLWGFWLVLAAGYVWAYAHTRSSADRQRLVDTRGVNLLPRGLRRWLFDD
jgi:hypothetical protein